MLGRLLRRRPPTRSLHRLAQLNLPHIISMKRELSTEPEGSVDAGKRARSKSPCDVVPVDTNLKTDITPHKYPSKQAAKAAKKFRKKIENVDPGTHDDVFWREVRSLLGDEVVKAAIEDGTDLDSPFKFHDEVELTISRMSSNGARSVTKHTLRLCSCSSYHLNRRRARRRAVFETLGHRCSILAARREGTRSGVS